MARTRYGFEYTDGKNTTTGEGRDLRIAGLLVAFNSAEERDEWVREGSDSYGGREAVTCASLPDGWRRYDLKEARDWAEMTEGL